MEKSDITIFIEEMEEIGDEWELEDVERVYGEYSLYDALQDGKTSLGSMFNIIGKAINRD